jgi:hypothetical protein
MVTPVAKREAVPRLFGTYEMSERRTCRLIKADPKTIRYRPESCRPRPLLKSAYTMWAIADDPVRSNAFCLSSDSGYAVPPHFFAARRDRCDQPGRTTEFQRDVRDLNAAKLSRPAIEGRAADPVLVTDVGGRHGRLLLTQDPNDLLFRKPQSLHRPVLPSDRTLASAGGNLGRRRTRKLSESATAIKVVGSKTAAFALLNFPQYPMQRYKTFIFPVRQ